MKNSLYREFENKYRGSRDLIKSRLQVYLPAVEKVKFYSHDLVALDLGCGRGEWLEIVNHLGFKERGVDLDEAMLSECRSRGLTVEQGDALAILQSLPENSVAIVTAFHVVEHMEFDKINSLIINSLRILQPGGLLILETPNPENIIVSTHQFLLDPTHNKPIPMQLLSFLIEESGFARTNTLRLQEDDTLADRNNISLHDILNGVSPDYGIVAQKSAEPALMTKLDSFFSSSHGISLEFLTDKYQKTLDEKFKLNAVDFQQLSHAVENLMRTNADLENKIKKVELSNQREREALKAKIDDKLNALSNNDLVMNKLFSCQDELKRVSDLLTATHNSTSWKITAPMRLVGNAIKGNGKGNAINFLIKRPVKKIISSMLNFINRDPKRRIAVINFCKKTRFDKIIRPIYAFVLKSISVNKVMPQNINEGSMLDAKLSPYGKVILNKLNR